MISACSLIYLIKSFITMIVVFTVLRLQILTRVANVDHSASENSTQQIHYFFLIK